MLDFPIVDAHVHLVDLNRLRYAWMAGVSALNRDWSPADLTARAKPYEIGGYVFVEVDVDAPQHMDEAAWIESVAKADPRLKGQVASLPLELGPSAVEPQMAQLAALSTVRGVRRLIQDRPDPEFMIRPEFVAAVKLLPKYNLSFDICIKHPQFANTLELVRRCPDVSFILDHIGKPGIAAGLIDPWRAHIAEMARFPARKRPFSNIFARRAGASLSAASNSLGFRDVAGRSGIHHHPTQHTGAPPRAQKCAQEKEATPHGLARSGCRLLDRPIPLLCEEN